MAHKNAQELLREVRELLREVEVYSYQRDALFEGLAALDKEYHAGRYPYLDYESRKKSILRSRTREEWENYYKAYIFSVLKKAEFIISQVVAIVYDDNSFNNLKIKGKIAATTAAQMPNLHAAASQNKTVASREERFPSAAAGKALPVIAQLPTQAPSQSNEHVQVFNIDNEIYRLRQLLVAGHVSPQQIDELKGIEGIEGSGKISVNIPKFDEIVRDVEDAERGAATIAPAPTAPAVPTPIPSIKILAQPSQQPQTRSQAQQQAQPQAKPVLEVYRAPKKQNAPSLPFARLLLKPVGAAVKFVVDVPLTAVRSLRDAFTKIRARTVMHDEKQKQVAKQPAPAKQPVHAKMPQQFVTFKERPQAQPVRAAPAKAPSPLPVGQKQGFFPSLLDAFNPIKAKRGIFVEEIVAMEKQSAAPEAAQPLNDGAGFSFGWFSVRGILKEVTDRFKSKQEPIMSETTAIPIHVKKLKEMRKKLYEEERLSGFDTTLLAQEARRVKKILEVERPEVYQSSSVGLIANITVRKFSLYLVDTFPEFFGFLYNALRSANVKVLSNTYVNIMILSTMFIVAASSIILSVMFFILSYPIYQIVLRTIILSIIAGFSCATIFYAYPFMKIKDRRRNIMTNMPFGANHMAAVATSGVPPASMFELIAASNEYGEIGVEVKKIVDFINIFGYDLLTAIRTVAATTPSPQFKEFLEGMVSTIETGGDLDRYLRQEADQAALTYNLERQRYNETVSTYSDIYTGLLIAAPLFFVAAMSLVNLLGGTVGGIGVDVIMSVGAYVIIPLLNIGFLAFLQLSQPEV